MRAAKLDGSALARRIKAALRPRVLAIKKNRGRAPGLLIVAGAEKDRPSKAYRQAQMNACAEIGIRAELIEKPWRDAREVLQAVREMPEFDGVIFDLPLPKAVDMGELLAGLPAGRDAEGAVPANFGRLFGLRSYEDVHRNRLIAPCTALAIAELLRAAKVPLAGKTAAVLGRSNIVGKPAAHLLTCLDLTVTLCHSKTRALPKLVSQADVVVAAMGKARLIKASWIKPGAILIDAGINADGERLCGDAHPSAAARTAFYTPVPGGVGPVTTAILLANTVTLAERARNARHE